MKKGVTKREYVKLIRRTETALARELKKNDALRDAALVDECIESLAYYRERLALMREPARSHSPAFLRTALSCALAFALTFALGATIAQAAGVRVWTAIFNWDADYLRVDYVPEASVSPTAQTFWTDEQKSFYDFASYAKELAENGFEPFAEEWNGYRFLEGGIRSTKNEYYSGCTMRSDEGYIRLRMIAKNRVDTTTSVWGLDSDIPAVHLDINGVDAAYQVSGKNAFATWQDGSGIFSVSVYDDPACIEALLYALLG